MTETLIRARFESIENLERALQRLKDTGQKRYEAYGPVDLKCLEDLMPRQGSGVRPWATAGGIIGLLSFWFMCVASALIYSLYVGGKPPWSNVPFVVVMYEGTILLGSIFAFFAGIGIAKLWPRKPPPDFDTRYSGSSFGLHVQCEPSKEDDIKSLLQECGAVEIDGN